MSPFVVRKLMPLPTAIIGYRPPPDAANPSQMV